MEKYQRIINIACAVVFIVGFVLTVADGYKTFFGLGQGFQYLMNFVYICIVLPACIGCSSLPEWATSPSSEKAVDAEEKPCQE